MDATDLNLRSQGTYGPFKEGPLVSQKPQQNNTRDGMIDEKSFRCPFFVLFFVSMFFSFFVMTDQIRSKLSLNGYSFVKLIIQRAEIAEIH